ncbi:MAG: GDP-mannose 4,6-dehydratase, partial [Thermoanaerobaculia bacterium]|nr:GDP-mannose 4,6-dehydratase [Thermoanaerobaculia bacterium]
LAAAVGVELIVQSPVRTIETNIRGTEILLEMVDRRGGCRTLLASTSEVYGKSERVPFAEDDDLLIGPPHKGRWAYACSKAIDEFLALAYAKERGLPVTVLRLFNVVGPRQTGRYGMVLPRLVGQALAGEPLTVFGDGRQRRCFADVGEVVGGMLRLMAEPAAVGEVVNIGGTEEIAMLDLARLVADRCGSVSEIRLVPYDEAYEPGFEDLSRRVPDLRKLEALTGSRPRRGLVEIVDDVIAFWRDAAGSD